MDRQFDRRRFLHSAGGALAAPLLWPARHAAVAATPEPRIKKSLKLGMVQAKLPLVDKFKLLKEIGFDGVEPDSPNNFELKEVLDARDRSGLVIDGVVDSVHWTQPLSHPDPKVQSAGLDGLKAALKDAKDYGGTSVLLVPATVSKQISYADAYHRSQAEIRKVIPLAEDLGIRILLENVWNNFLLSPLEFARYIDELGSPIVGAHFDVGNIVTFGWPEQWIRILGKRVVKIDVKEYSRKQEMEHGQRAGAGVEIGEGDCDWPAVMAALADIGFEGWAAAEVRGGDEQRLREVSLRMDRVLKFPQ
jgi:hexulose-6-phosphate isomerase